MNRVPLISALVVVVAASTPGLASAQSRSMIPPETLETTLRRQDAMFDRFDLNHDGSITTTELEAAAAAMRAQMGAGGPPPGASPGAPPAGGGQGPNGAGGGPGGGAGRGGGFMARMMQDVDADGDGQITRAEMRASGTKRFAEMDKNGDGVLSADERPQGGMRGPGGGQGRPQGGGQPVQIPMGDDGG